MGLATRFWQSVIFVWPSLRDLQASFWLYICSVVPRILTIFISLSPWVIGARNCYFLLFEYFNILFNPCAKVLSNGKLSVKLISNFIIRFFSCTLWSCDHRWWRILYHFKFDTSHRGNWFCVSSLGSGPIISFLLSGSNSTSAKAYESSDTSWDTIRLWPGPRAAPR